MGKEAEISFTGVLSMDTLVKEDSYAFSSFAKVANEVGRLRVAIVSTFGNCLAVGQLAYVLAQ